MSASNLGQVKNYIRNQEEHHKGRDFLGEFNAMLQRHGIKTRAEQMFEEFQKAEE